MKSDYPHLGKDALEVIDLPYAERIFAIRRDTWISYTRAKQILDRLDELLEYPRNIRMPNAMIVGPSNNGKTHILRHFEAKHKRDPNPDGECAIIPVLFVEAPRKPNINEFYDRVLKAIWEPYVIRAHDSDKERAAIKMIRNVQLRVLLIDEIQHIIAGGQVKQREFRNALKSLGNETQISIVAAGIEEAFNAFNTDPQLSNRFEPEFLSKWTMNNEYVDLLNSFERRLPLKKPSILREPELAQKVVFKAEGILGEIHEVLKRAAILAIKQGTEQITSKVVDGIRWTMPSKRKQATQSN